MTNSVRPRMHATAALWLRRAFARASRSPLLGTYLAAIPLYLGIAVATLLARASGDVWGNSELLLTYLVVAVALARTARAARGTARMIPASIAVTFAVCFVAQVPETYEAFIGHNIGGVEDFAWFAGAPFALLPLIFFMRERLDRTRALVVLLDVAAILGGVLLVALLVVSRAIADVPIPELSLGLMYGSAALSTAIATLVTAAAVGERPRPSGMYLLAGAISVAAFLLAFEEFAKLAGVGPGVSLIHAGVAIAALAAGGGAATWQIEAPETEHEPFAILSLLPLVAIAIIAIILFDWEAFDRAGLGFPATFVSAVVILVIGVRQSVLLLDRGRLIAREREMVVRTREALREANAARTDQRARADALARILMTSESLSIATADTAAYAAAVRELAPPGADAVLARFDRESRRARVIVALGPRAAGLEGTEVPFEASDPPSLDAAGILRVALERSPEATPPHARVPGLATGGPDAGPDRAAMTLPLHDRTGGLVGVLHLIGAADQLGVPFMRDMARLLANQLAIAFENAALIERLGRQVDELRRMQAQLVHASRLAAVGELAAGVAHELNNPLAAILGYAELLLDALPENGPQAADVAVIRDEALRARDAVRRILEFARTPPTERATERLDAVVREAIELVQMPSGTTVSASLAELPPAEIDPRAIRDAVRHVLENAVDAAGPGGRVMVQLYPEGDQAVLEISDDGAGMEEWVRSHAFEPFFTTRPGSGRSGLGLSLSRTIIAAHGGTIELDSRPAGGTRVTIRLPQAAAVAA